jgi:hypothetical protein
MSFAAGRAVAMFIAERYDLWGDIRGFEYRKRRVY